MKGRLHLLQRTLKIDVLLIDQPIDLYYLTGLKVSKGRLAVAKDKAVLFVDSRYYDVAKEKSFCKVVLSEKASLKEELKEYASVGVDSAFVSIDGLEMLKEALPHKKWVFCPEPLRQLRLYKDETEIGLLKKAAQLTRLGIEHAAACLKEGVSEIEIAWEFEKYCREKGAIGMSFSPIVAFGENGAYPHHCSGKTVLKKNQMVLIDAGAIVDGYSGDMTRMFSFGKAPDELQKRLEWVKEAQKLALRAIQIGMEVGELDAIVREAFEKLGVCHLFTHSLGHGIGLETHEYPRIRVDGPDRQCVLKPGMVFTLEPGLYQSGLGGVRYEDMVLIEERGGVVL